MSDSIFIDTNILVYAHDNDAGERHEHAKQRIEECWSGMYTPVISVQVLQELHVTLVRKQVPHASSRQLVRAYTSWRVIDNTVEVLSEAFNIQEQNTLSFWDASIIAAAMSAGCTQLWSEDLQEGQHFGNVRVYNPLR